MYGHKRRCLASRSQVCPWVDLVMPWSCTYPAVDVDNALPKLFYAAYMTLSRHALPRPIPSTCLSVIWAAGSWVCRAVPGSWLTRTHGSLPIAATAGRIVTQDWLESQHGPCCVYTVEWRSCPGDSASTPPGTPPHGMPSPAAADGSATPGGSTRIDTWEHLLMNQAARSMLAGARSQQVWCECPGRPGLSCMHSWRSQAAAGGRPPHATRTADAGAAHLRQRQLTAILYGRDPGGTHMAPMIDH